MVILLSLLLSVAEGVWASTCMPGMDLTETAASAESLDAAMAEMPMPMRMPMPMPPEEDRGGSADYPDTDCPLIPASTSGSCVAAPSLPATAVTLVSGTSVGESRLAATESNVALLLSHSFFRPPRV